MEKLAGHKPRRHKLILVALNDNHLYVSAIGWLKVKFWQFPNKISALRSFISAISIR